MATLSQSGCGRRRRARPRAAHVVGRLPRGRVPRSFDQVVPNDDGLEVVVVDGAPFTRISPGGIALIGSMGEEGARPSADRRYAESMPFGACDATRSSGPLRQGRARRRGAVPDHRDRVAVGRRRRAPRRRVRPGVQPLDRRLLPRFRRAPDPDRAVEPRRPRARGARAGARGGRRLPRRVRPPVHLDPHAARPPVLRPAVGGGRARRRAHRHPPRVRARVRQHAHPLPRTRQFARCRRARARSS